MPIYSEGQPVEAEAALLIRSSAPEKVASVISGLTRLGPYSLAPQPPQAIHDRYFDTEDRKLGHLLLALRLRETNGERLITLKGPGRPTGSGVERLEIELAVSPQALDHVLGELRARGVDLSTPREKSADDVATLAGAGLAVVQDRKTVRIPRSVILPPDDRVLAELAVDRVTYRFGRQTVVLHEVEVEAKADPAHIGPTVEGLKREVPELEEWPYSKLATGKAIERGLANGRLARHADGTLDSRAYDWLADTLSQEG